MLQLEKYLSSFSGEELKHLPKNLFLAGNSSLLTQGRRVAVIGSREASKAGLLRAGIIAKNLVKHDITVVSGLAKGIDTQAHTAAIDANGRTIAVLGTPLAVAYPKENATLLELIKQQHLALSQFSDDYPTTPKNFPMRNRTMALISDATIIVEATAKSGTRHQGAEALRLGRALFILENVIKEAKVPWAIEMLDKGAKVLTQENMELHFKAIPFYTANLKA